MFKKFTAFLIIAAIGITFLSACGTSAETVLENAPKAFSSEEQIKSVIEKFNRESYGNRSLNYSDQKAAEDSLNAAPEAAQGDYSGTNTQVKGVDEGDIVKNDSRYIYKLQANGFIIVEADNGNLRKVAEIRIDNYVPQELYVIGNKLVLIGGIYKNFYYPQNAEITPMCRICFSYSSTDIRIYDISDIENPLSERQITLSGYYNTSRLIQNKLYFITNYYFYYGQPDGYIPRISDSTVNGGQEQNIAVENIFYYESVPSFEYMILGMIDLSAPQTNSDVKAYLGLGGNVYVSAENVYVASTDYSGCYRKNFLGNYSVAEYGFARTRLIKIALSDLTQKGAAKIDGTIKDRYSLDEYEGNLRVATTVNKWVVSGFRSVTEADSSDETSPSPSVNTNIYNNVYVLDERLEVIGKIENIAYGETIYSVSYNGSKGSLVTFAYVDPYFILDFSDPYNPKISKGLKEEGVSQYLKDVGGGYTIGAGRQTESITTEWGTRVVWKGLKVSLYNISGEEAVNAATPELDHYDYVFAELFYNPKALLYNENRGLFGFAAEMWNYSNDNYYWQPVNMNQGVLIFAFDTSAGTLEYRGLLSNFNADINTDNWVNYYNNYWSFIKRAVQIGDYIYTISERYIVSYDYDNLTETGRLEAVKPDEIYGGLYK